MRGDISPRIVAASKEKNMNTLKLTLLMLAAAFAGTLAFATQSAAPQREQLRESISYQVVDEFLVDSKRYLGL